MKDFLKRFSKALGGLGGSSLGALIGWVLTIKGVQIPDAQTILPILGGLLATTLAPPNSLTTPTPEGNTS